MVVFDLAMLELTRLPVVAHDFVMLKQIEDDAIEKIMELYANTLKQVFIAMDKEGQRKRFADGKVSFAYSRVLGLDKGPDGKIVVNQQEAGTVKLIFS